MYKIIGFLAFILLLSVESFAETFEVEVLRADLAHPWSVAFLSANEVIVTERGGGIFKLDLIKGTKVSLVGGPNVIEGGQGGLLDVLIDRDFQKNSFVYFSYTGGKKSLNETQLARGVLKGNRIENLKVIWKQNRSYGNSLHFGSRLVMDDKGFIFMTTGDRFTQRDQAQDLKSHLGKVIRIDREGKAAPGNPFDGKNGLQDIWSYGHRNIQGASLHPVTKELWTHEHGPRGGDEINITRAGKNYGWPVITYGREYYGPKIGEGTAKAGMEAPLYQWTPSIAISGMTFYTGEAFPQWKGNLFVGALKDEALHRLVLEGEKVVSTERLLADRSKRIRDVRQGPDGFLYVLTDEKKGELLRIKPRPSTP